MVGSALHRLLEAVNQKSLVCDSGSFAGFYGVNMIKATFTLTTATAQQLGGYTDTPLLVLGTLAGMGFGTQISGLDGMLGGVISGAIAKKSFQCNLGNNFTLRLNQEGAPAHVLVVGLGSPDRFNRKAIIRLVRIAVARAVQLGCPKVTFPILPNRQTQATRNLRGQAFLLRKAVEEKLAEIGGDEERELEVELLCSPQAKPHLTVGLTCKQMNEAGDCCADGPDVDVQVKCLPTKVPKRKSSKGS